MSSKLISIGSLVLVLAACCPTKKMEVKEEMATTTKSVVLNVADRVFFDFNKSILKSEGKHVLDEQVAWLKSNPNEKITIEGHTDVRGTDAYNMKLGQRRADAVKKYLVSKKVSADRIRAVTQGKSHPEIVDAKTEADHAKNRRAVTLVQ